MNGVATVDGDNSHSGRNQTFFRADTLGMLSFQRLDVYQRAIEFLAVATEIFAALPRGHAERGDQLIRAAESVLRNIAEGAGRWSNAESVVAMLTKMV